MTDTSANPKPIEPLGETPRHDVAESARRHYKEASDAVKYWSSTIVRAIDLWESHPVLVAELESLRATTEAQAQRIVELEGTLREGCEWVAFLRSCIQSREELNDDQWAKSVEWVMRAKTLSQPIDSVVKETR